MPKHFLVALIMGIGMGMHALPVQSQEDILRTPDTAQNRLFLADTLGALHYLTVACSGRMDQSWRGRMAEMMQLEPLSAYERDDLVAAFNHGYRQEKRYFRRCTPRTVSQINAQKRLKAEQGQFLSTALADPYLH